MVKSLDLMSLFMVIISVWNLLGFATGVIQAARLIATVIGVVLTALIILFLPLNRDGRRWTLLVTVALGAIAAVWGGLGVAFAPWQIKIGAGVSLALGVLIAIFGFRAYRVKP